MMSGYRRSWQDRRFFPAGHECLMTGSNIRAWNIGYLKSKFYVRWSNVGCCWPILLKPSNACSVVHFWPSQLMAWSTIAWWRSINSYLTWTWGGDDDETKPKPILLGEVLIWLVFRVSPQYWIIWWLVHSLPTTVTNFTHWEI